jgi:hypothetical protein
LNYLTLVFAALVLQGTGLSVGAAEIEIGDRVIEIPLPDEYAELTPQMSPMYEAMQAYISPQNVRFMTLIAEDKAAALLRGEAVDLGRYINVESQKDISAASITSAQFAELRSAFRNQIAEMYANVEKQLPDLVAQGNSALSETFSADVAVELGGLVPLPVHHDVDNAIANSMFMTVGTTVNSEDAGVNVLAATSLILHVRDKVLFLYVYGTESDLEWTRNTAANWSTEIIDANPLSTDEQRAVDKSGSAGIDWNRVLERTLIGALIGGVIGLLSLLFRKRRKT